MRLLLGGTRGSTPAPGPDFIRTGGQTSCIGIAHGDADPTLVLDGGTGLRTLSRMIDGRTFVGTILIGHMHWDHTHGLPFFRAGDHPDARVSVLIPEQGMDASALMARAMSPPHFPIALEELRGDWSIRSIEEGTHDIEGFSVVAAEIPHKGARTFGFRVSDGAGTIAYLSDHAPANDGDGPHGLGLYHDAARLLCAGVDLLIHDAQYTADEFPVRRSFGHSAVDYAIGLAETCGAKAVLLTHHDPDRTDDQIDEILAKARASTALPVDVAIEGTTIMVPS